MKKLLFASLLAFVGCDHEQGSSFDLAAAAAGRSEFKKAADLYAVAARNETDPVRRVRAAIRLSNIEWRVFGKHASAQERLRRVAVGQHEAFAARLELGRIALDRKQGAVARAEVREALKIAKTRRDRRRAAVALAHVVLETPRAGDAELRAVIDSLRGVIAEVGPSTETTRLLAKASLLAGDGARAIEAIDGYYHVSEFSKPPSGIAASHATLARVLPAWRGTDEERAVIVEALGGIRFFEEAEIVSRRQVSDVVAYARMIGRVKDLVGDYYQRLARGEADDDELKKGVDRELRDLWPMLSKETYDRKRVEAELARRFGSYVNVGKTGGFLDLHFGHVVGDRVLPIEQYGRKATLRFIELDSMVSNGYGEFLSDGAGGDGGWATKKEVYQVRSQYANGPLRDWQMMSDPEVRAENEREMAEETARDRDRARARPIGEFPGLVKRLQNQYLATLFADLRERNLVGEALRDAFLARIEKETFQYSILLHEGRHAIDQLSDERFDSWELEYRAKLSEIGLADAPRAALQSVVDNTIGGGSPHGKANEHLMKGMTAWMEANRSAIKGLDASLPMMPQLDKLSDAQIQAAIRSLDPMAQKKTAATRRRRVGDGLGCSSDTAAGFITSNVRIVTLLIATVMPVMSRDKSCIRKDLEARERGSSDPANQPEKQS